MKETNKIKENCKDVVTGKIALGENGGIKIGDSWNYERRFGSRMNKGGSNKLEHGLKTSGAYSSLLNLNSIVSLDKEENGPSPIERKQMSQNGLHSSGLSTGIFKTISILESALTVSRKKPTFLNKLKPPKSNEIKLD